MDIVLHDDDVGILLERFPTGKCWSIRLYMGSMFVADFGERLLIPRMRGLPVVCGESTLSVRNCYWEAMNASTSIADAETVTADSFALNVSPLVCGSSLVDIARGATGKTMTLVLSGGVTFELDITGRWSTDDLLAEIVLRDGRYVQLQAGGQWSEAEDGELVRRQRWLALVDRQADRPES